MNEAEKGRIGSSFDDFLKEEGILEELHAQALRACLKLLWQEHAFEAHPGHKQGGEHGHGP